MGQVVMTGATVKCPFGSNPATLTSASACKAKMSAGQPATIMDFGPQCIPTFGMCSNPVNPQVAAATAAALGVLTPQPCQMVPLGPWIPVKPQVVIDGKPVLTTDCTLMCAWAGGIVTVTSPGQNKVQV